MLVGRADALAPAAGWPRCTRRRRHRSRRDGRSDRGGAAAQEGFVDARGDQPGQGRTPTAGAGAGLRVGRQHRRADGGGALRAEDGRRHRPSGDRHRDAERASDGFTTVLDLGANVDCTAEHLLQFAVMGSALVGAVERQRRTRRVGLLNIGEEAIKGSETIKQRRRAAARGGRRRPPELLRQRRRQRHLQGHDRHRGLRRLRRQRRAEDQPKAWPRCSASFIKQEFTRNAADQAGGAGGAAGAQRTSRRASTTAATTARRCWACAAWCSRATARPMRSPSSRRWTARMMRPATTCSTACTTASPTRCRPLLAPAKPTRRRSTPS